ncbi:MAG: hypothetical protein KBB55_04200 [Candidatus Buchananbacteria bacterium]|nr:hypothetical protein [Candidatus Buchananbacteria bacterium]
MLLLNPTPFELPDNWEGSLTPISIRRTKNQDAQKKAAEMLASDAGLVMEVVKVDQVPAIKLSGISQAEAYSTGHYVEMFYIQQGRDIIVLAEDTNKAQYQETFNQIVATLDIIQ